MVTLIIMGWIISTYGHGVSIFINLTKYDHVILLNYEFIF